MGGSCPCGVAVDHTKVRSNRQHMDTKTTTHATPERERTGIAKLEIVTRPYATTPYEAGDFVALLSILFDDMPPTHPPHVLQLPANWCEAADVLATTWPHVALTTPGLFDAIAQGWQSAQRQKESVA